MFSHSFESGDNVFLLNETHFTVNLCEFRLTVGTQVLIAEAAGDLHIAVEARDH